MKKILFPIISLFIFCGISFAETKIDASKDQAFSSAVSVSTTPALFQSSTTLLNVEEVRVYNYSSDVVYINFTNPVSSTTAAATGIKVFQTSENNEYISLTLDKTASIYLTFAADSGTASLRVLEVGRKYKVWF